mgnify:CR=1 FL=1
MKRNKLLIIIAAIVVIALVVLVILKKNGAIGKDDTIKVTLEKVELRDIIETVTANGKIQPEKDIKVSPFISGEIVELTVKEGDQVELGQLLAKIDPEMYQSAYNRAEASLNSQKANMAQAKAGLSQAEADFMQNRLDFERNQQLWDKQVISDAEFERIEAAYEMSKSNVDAAEESLKAAEFQVKVSQASLREAKENLTRTAVFAPQNGTVSLLSVEKGERVQGASQFSAGTELMRIANLNNMEVHVEVNENDIVRVSIGDTAVIEVDAYLKDKFKGIVTEIATSANTQGTSADQVTNFDVKVMMLSQSYHHLTKNKPDAFSPFRPGMSASVDIQTEIRIQVPTVEIAAVTTRDDTTGKVKSTYEKMKEKDKQKESEENKNEIKEYVFAYEAGEAVMYRIKTGIQNNKYIEVLSGLEVGQEVINGPYSAISKELKNHDKVEETDKDKLFEKKE